MTDLAVVAVAEYTGPFPNFGPDEDPGFYVMSGELLLGWFPAEESANQHMKWIEGIREFFSLPEWLPGSQLPGRDNAR